MTLSRRPATGNQALLRRLQAKLTIGPVNDPLEHEADAVAEQVMRMPEPAVGVSAAPPRVSRKCATCEEEDAQKLQTKHADTSSEAREAPGIVHNVLNAPGQPLDAATRAFMEPRFGADLGDVRVHTGADAAQSARAVGANAYTVGHDLVFGKGQFAPGTPSGAKLLAHELTHAMQQGVPGSGEIGRQLQMQSDPKYTPQLAGRYTGYQSSPFPIPPPPVVPCHTGPECSQAIPGSNWDFAHKVSQQQKTEAGLQQADPARARAAGSAGPAVNVTAFANKKDPTLIAGITVVMNPLIGETAGAQATDCNGNAPKASQPACIEVPNHLENEALTYNTKTDAMIAGRTRFSWETEMFKTLTHEKEHIRFANAAPVAPGATMNTQNVFQYSPDIFMSELDEMNSLLSEYPIQYRAVMASTTVPAADKPATIKEWIGTYAIANGMEDLRGMLAKLRCVSSCSVVNDGVKKVYRAQSAGWTDDQKTLFVTEVKDPKYRLDWPAS